MRKLESVYKAMKWNNEKYDKITKAVSKNTKDSRNFCIFSGENTLTALKRIFQIKENVFDEKFAQACSGSGQEERRITTLHSSSLCALLFFYNVTKEHPLKIVVENVGEVEFVDSIFEYQNMVIEGGNPSNLDVTLLGKCEDKNVILFLESKFSEYITGRQKRLKVNGAYLREEISKLVYENWQWGKIEETNEKEFTISALDQSVYLAGLKQMISHYVGVRKFERGIRRIADGQDGGHDLYNVTNNYVKQANQEKVQKFAMERETLIVLGSVVFDVYSNDVKHTELKEYELLYAKLMKQLAEDVEKNNSNIRILARFYTYQEVFKSRKDWLKKDIYDFYFNE